MRCQLEGIPDRPINPPESRPEHDSSGEDRGYDELAQDRADCERPESESR